MKRLVQLAFFLLCVLFVLACNKRKELSSLNPENWQKRTVNVKFSDSLESGSTYLPVYSAIYGSTEHRTYNLSATVSLRNTSHKDTAYILKADYYNTHGVRIRTYFDKAIFLAPMETVEIIIDETDKEGGTGANFVFDWMVYRGSNHPFFESVMISTSGQQGLSFSSRGVEIMKD